MSENKSNSYIPKPQKVIAFYNKLSLEEQEIVLDELRGTVVMGKHDDRCLNCGSDSIIFNWDKFCPQCGQRIKREE